MCKNGTQWERTNKGDERRRAATNFKREKTQKKTREKKYLTNKHLWIEQGNRKARLNPLCPPSYLPVLFCERRNIFPRVQFK